MLIRGSHSRTIKSGFLEVRSRHKFVYSFVCWFVVKLPGDFTVKPGMRIIA